MTSTPWIHTTLDLLGFTCTRCGGRLELGASVSPALLAAAQRGFAADHADCAPVPAAVEVRRAGGRPLPGFEL